AITASLADPDGKLPNYQVTENDATLTINKAHLTVTADAKSRSYGAAEPGFTAKLSGFVLGQTEAALRTSSAVTGHALCSTTATPTSTVAGSPYPISCAGGDLAATNYDFTTFVNGKLTITTAPLTVTVDNQTKTYGDPNPALTGTVSGVLNSDN